MSTVLVVDDKEMMRDSVCSTLQRAGFTVIGAPGAEAALELVATRRPNAVVTDLKMPGMTGIELLEKLREVDDELPVVLMTAFGTIETAVHAMRLGAYDYITKPFEGDELVITVKRAIQHGSLVRENAVLKAQAHPAGAVSSDTDVCGLDRVIGESPAMRRVKEQVMAVAESHGTVLICGESGTGKEVIARAVHELSPRIGNPMLAVNCAALSESLLESELFGHEKGAFTGADKLRKGRFELADAGTLLLDEVSEVPAQIQAKLLRVLQERSFERVGSSMTIGVDVRVVATSNRELPKAVADGQFRQDLFFRLNVLPVHLPPLRDRIEDVPALAKHFLDRISERDGRSRVRFDTEALELLMGYSWPGNVRELQNVCERAAVLSTAGARGRGADEVLAGRSLIESWLGSPAASPAQAILGQSIAATLPEPATESVTAVPNGAAVSQLPGSELELRPLEDIERDVIVRTLEHFGGHRQKTARALGIGVRTLGLKLKKWKELRLVSETL